MTPEELGLPWQKMRFKQGGQTVGYDIVQSFDHDREIGAIYNDHNAEFIVHAANSFFAMRYALRFYADEKNHQWVVADDGNILVAAPIKFDRGEIAREALSLAEEWKP